MFHEREISKFDSQKDPERNIFIMLIVRHVEREKREREREREMGGRDGVEEREGQREGG